MNELNTRLLEYLPDPNTVKGGIGSVVEGLQSEAPLLVKEILLWVGCMSCLKFLTFLILLFLCRKVFTNLWKAAVILEAKDEYWKGLRLANLFFLIPSALFFWGMWYQLAWLKILIAPRLFLLEYISNLLH